MYRIRTEKAWREALRLGKGAHVWVSDKVEVLLFQQGKSLRAVQSICPHMGAQLQWDEKGNRVLCPWHELDFCSKTLKSCHERYRSLKEFSVQESDEEITLA